jgi:hypothetical protein
MTAFASPVAVAKHIESMDNGYRQRPITLDYHRGMALKIQ